MAKKKTPKDIDKELLKLQIDTYFRLRKMYDDSINTIVDKIRLSGVPMDEPIDITKHTQLYRTINGEVKKMNVTMYDYIRDSAKEAWNLANEKASSTVEWEFEKRGFDAPKQMLKTDENTNTKAFYKFIQRKTNKFTISDRVWAGGEGFKKEIEEAINAAIAEGKGAEQLAREIRKYLKNPNSRYNAFKDPNKVKWKQYHPGRGVYRSSHKNALRLARNEINLAFHQAEHERWMKLPFIIGYYVRNNINRVSTVCEVCKAINGEKFPKEIHVLPVHIQCMCSAETIMCSNDLFEKIARGESVDMPKVIMSENAKRHVREYL